MSDPGVRDSSRSTLGSSTVLVEVVVNAISDKTVLGDIKGRGSEVARAGSSEKVIVWRRCGGITSFLSWLVQKPNQFPTRARGEEPGGRSPPVLYRSAAIVPRTNGQLFEIQLGQIKPAKTLFAWC